jgi:hypothetical protein
MENVGDLLPALGGHLMALPAGATAPR